MIKSTLKNYLSSFEPLFFYGFLAFSLYPLFSTSTFPFLDAPAHLGNASLINQLLDEPKAGFLSNFISFNNRVVPNWMGHFILAGLMHFFSSEIAEKGLLVSIFAGLPLALRYLLYVVKRERRFLALLAIPIAYNCHSGIGFYNFSMGLIFLFLNLAFFNHKILRDDPRWYHYLVMFLLLVFAYFSHIVTFLVTLLFLALVYFVHNMRLYGGSLKNWFNKKTMLIVLAMIPVCWLVIAYMRASEDDSQYIAYLKNSELVDYFKNGKPFLIFGDMELNWSAFLAALYGGAFLLALYTFVNEADRGFFKKDAAVYLFFIFLLLVFYIVLPDWRGRGGYFSMRMAIMIFILIIPFTAVSNIRKWFLWAVTCGALIVHVQRLSLYERINIDNNNIASAVLDQSRFIEKNSFIVPYNFASNWLFVNYSHYLCLEKPIITLDNYECNTEYFPLIWKNGAKMNALHDALHDFKALDLCKKELGYYPIYYWILGDPQSQGEVGVKLKKNLENNCILVNSNNFASLYKLR